MWVNMLKDIFEMTVTFSFLSFTALASNKLATLIVVLLMTFS
jgi:hypothetical protein